MLLGKVRHMVDCSHVVPELPAYCPVGSSLDSGSGAFCPA